MLSKRLHSERDEPPHALKSSQRGRMISDFQVQELESKELLMSQNVGPNKGQCVDVHPITR